MRVDLFGVKEGGDDRRQARSRRCGPQVPTLEARAERICSKSVMRTLKLGHPFTQGTVDSNEVWVDVTVTSGGTRDRPQRRARRRTARSIRGRTSSTSTCSTATATASTAAIRRTFSRRSTTTRFRRAPRRSCTTRSRCRRTQREPLTVEVKLQYRKFDTIYMKYVFGKDYTNDLPITTICVAIATRPFPVEGGAAAAATNCAVDHSATGSAGTITASACSSKADKGSEKGELIQAAQAFRASGKTRTRRRPAESGARLFQGRPAGRRGGGTATRRRSSNPPAPRWTVAWLNGLVNKQNGYLDKAIAEFRSILEDRYPELDKRGFDFSKDYEVINELGPDVVRARQDGTRRCQQRRRGIPATRPSSSSRRRWRSIPRI